jgi:hypothetical protein
MILIMLKAAAQELMLRLVVLGSFWMKGLRLLI